MSKVMDKFIRVGDLKWIVESLRGFDRPHLTSIADKICLLPTVQAVTLDELTKIVEKLDNETFTIDKLERGVGWHRALQAVLKAIGEKQ